METDNLPKFKRRMMRITHRKFQLSFLLLIFAIGIVTTLISVIAMRLTVSGLSDLIGSIHNLNWDQIEELLRTEADKATVMIIIASTLNMIFTAVIAFYFSHHVAGIMFRVTNTLRQWSAGEPVNTIVPRKGDFFVELVEEVNEVIKAPRPPRV